ncbi:outer membrane protein [Microvirga sp. TS319]|uniref:outer membrane protein n=1 Tax=Microvirga sp. TS319 TaxID=3241165 RepID=UPI00351A5225
MRSSLLCLLAGTAVVATASATLAADLPSRVAPAPLPAIAAVPLFTWTGFYAGVNAGYGFSNHDDDSIGVPVGTFTGAFAATSGTVAAKEDNGGFVGGGQIGYNYQIGQFVVGVETDLQFADIGNAGRDATFTVATGAFPAGFTPRAGRDSLDYFGTVRARAGVAFDRALVYVTGGYAYGGYDLDGAISSSGDDVRHGYAVGGGVEYAFTNNLTAKVEGMYVDLNNTRGGYIGTGPGGTGVYVVDARRQENDFGVIRAGLNYKFGGF